MINEKTKEIFAYFAKTLNEQRTIISKKSISDFVEIYNNTFDYKIDIDTMERMEAGDPTVSIIYWVQIWTYFQNIEKIKKAYDPKEMLFLAQQEFLPDIEKEILKQHEKN